MDSHATQPIKWLTLISLAIVSVGFALWLGFTPWIDDDLHYMAYFRDYINHGGDYPWDSFSKMVTTEWHINNIRWPNMLTAFTHTVIPRWITAAGLGLSAGLCCHWMIALARAKGKLMSTAFIIGAFVLLMPWHARLAITDYALNYLPASALFAAFFLLWLRDGGTAGRLRLAALSLLGFVAGASHEGFTIPALAGIAVYLAFNRGEVNRRRMAMTAGLALGLALLLSARGAASRFAIDDVPLWKTAIMVIMLYTPLTLALAATVGAAWITRRRAFWREAVHSPLIIALTASAAALAMTIVINLNARVAWAGELSAIVAIVVIVNRWLGPVTGRRVTFVRNAAGVTLLAVTIGHIAAVDYYAHLCGADYRPIIDSYAANPSATIYYDYIDDYQVPSLTLGKVMASYPWTADQPLTCAALFYASGSNAPRVVPPALRDFTAARAVKIPGDNPLYLYHNRWVAPAGAITPDADVVVTSAYPIRVSRKPQLIPFTTLNGDSLEICAIEFPARVANDSRLSIDIQ